MCECSCDAVCGATESVQVLNVPPNVAIHKVKKDSTGSYHNPQDKDSRLAPAGRRSVEVNGPDPWLQMHL